MLAEHAFPRRWVHQFVHQTQAGHCIFRIAHSATITRSDFLLREFRAERRAADQQRYADTRVLQVARRSHHLLRAFHQQARKSDGIRLVHFERLDQFLRRHFYAQVDHVKSVVFEDNLDKILPNVVDIAFHRGQDDSTALCSVSLFHELLEMAYGGFHRLGRLQHLGHNQFVCIEESAHFCHAVHQRAIDNVERCGALRSFVFQVLDQSIARAFDDVVC